VRAAKFADHPANAAWPLRRREGDPAVRWSRGNWHGYCLSTVRENSEGSDTVMVSKIQGALSFQLQALTLRSERQQVLAGNIANADTPHYLARDFDFATTLQQAVSGRGQASLPLATTSPRHAQGREAADPLRLLYRQPTQASADGNTVDMDVERAQFAENAFFYEAGLTFLSGRINTLRSAIQGQ